ncbi:MAG: helix-turn-helix domain-containing protein [Bythopirellula sp.]
MKGQGKAAERFGLAPSTLRYRMKKLGIQRPPSRPR